jgi:hypothetical protein
MPPLESMPRVINVESVAEWAVNMLRFHRGEYAYVKAHDLETDATYELFVPHDIDYREALGGLMMDGITHGEVSGEYFADSQTYRRMHPEPLLDAQEAIDELGIGRRQKGKFGRFLDRLINTTRE